MNIVISSTTQLAVAIRAGDVSASEVLEAHLVQDGKRALHFVQLHWSSGSRVAT
jgi:hypothetical protein